MRRIAALILGLLLPASAIGQIGFSDTFGVLSTGGGVYTLISVTVSGQKYVESAAGSYVIGAVTVSTTGQPVGTLTVSLTGANAKGYRLSSSSLPSNLICPSGGCPAGAGPDTDVTLNATDTGAVGSPVTLALSISGATNQLTAVTPPTNFIESSAASSVIGAITTTTTGTSFAGSYSITGTNSGGFAISGSNLICNASTGCPATAGPFTDFNVVATQSGSIGSPFTQAASLTGTPAYSGPGDAVSGATAWWGMRAWNNAYAVANGKLFNARNGTTAETCDFLANAATGGVGVAASCSGSSNGVSLATFAGANTLFITKYYNQTSGGATYDAPQATTADQPQIILNCDTGGHPCAILGQSARFVLTGAVTSVSLPYTWEAVAARASGTSGSMTMLGGNPGTAIFFAGSNQWQYYNTSSSSTFTQTDGTIHEIALNAVSGTVTGWTDGSSTSGSTVGNAATGPAFFWGNGSTADVEHWFEGGIWPSTVTGTCHNPRLYYTGIPGSC